MLEMRSHKSEVQKQRLIVKVDVPEVKMILEQFFCIVADQEMCCSRGGERKGKTSKDG